MGVLAGFTYLLPDFNKFSTTHFVAYGYDVNNHLLAEHAVLAAFSAGAIVAGTAGNTSFTNIEKVVTGDFNASEGSDPYKALFGTASTGPSPLIDSLRIAGAVTRARFERGR